MLVEFCEGGPIVHSQVLQSLDVSGPFGPCDILVDAMETPRTLEELGWNQPPRSTVTIVARNPTSTSTDWLAVTLSDHEESLFSE